MRVIDRKTFLDQPRGTLFVKVHTGGAGALQMKLDTVPPNDFIYRDMIEVDAESDRDYSSMFWDACEQKVRADIPLDWHIDMSRDGLYDDEQMFAVLDADEAASLIAMLTAAKDGVV